MYAHTLIKKNLCVFCLILMFFLLRIKCGFKGNAFKDKPDELSQRLLKVNYETYFKMSRNPSDMVLTVYLIPCFSHRDFT